MVAACAQGPRLCVHGASRQALAIPAKVAVFVDGCFWHMCPEHATFPKANADWWREKLERNYARDQDTDRLLLEQGWLPVRVWEHEEIAGGCASDRRDRARAPPATTTQLRSRIHPGLG